MWDPPYALWSIWKDLSVLQRLFVLTLCVVSAYSLYSASMTLLRLRSIGNVNPNENFAPIRRSVDALFNLCASVRQVIGATFYLFGLVLFLGLQTVGRTLGDGPTTVGSLVLGNFILHFAFAANVFFIFLVLHLVQWFVFSRLNSYSQRLNARHA
jgi:hypothetical protein